MEINNILGKLGLDKYINNIDDKDMFFFIVVLLTALTVCRIFLFIFNTYVYKVIKKGVENSKNRWDDVILSKKFFKKIGYLFAIIIFRIIIDITEYEYVWIVDRIADIAILVCSTLIATGFTSGVNQAYESYEVAKFRPIKGFIQAINIVIYIILTICLISVIGNKSLHSIFIGLGAFAAVVMLIFKDSILGLMAGIQLVANQQIKIGDWIVLSGDDVDGVVTDISLHVVSVKNWNQTTSTVPTYKLFSEPFTNWRSMEEGDGRQIQRSLNIDADTIHFVTEQELEQFKNNAILKPYIEKIVEDGTTQTNIGIYRKYLKLWIMDNPNINKEMTCIVRQLDPTPMGVPIQIYCFSAVKDWSLYEDIQSEMFDHIFSVTKQFNLKIYQYSALMINESNK